MLKNLFILKIFEQTTFIFRIKFVIMGTTVKHLSLDFTMGDKHENFINH